MKRQMTIGRQSRSTSFTPPTHDRSGAPWIHLMDRIPFSMAKPLSIAPPHFPHLGWSSATAVV
jgi:hypothetical protein